MPLVVSLRSVLFVPFVPFVAIPGNDPPAEFYIRPRYVLKADIALPLAGEHVACLNRRPGRLLAASLSLKLGP